MQRARASLFLVALAGLVLVTAGLAAWVPSFRTHFVDPYLWWPLALDEGYNAVNTTALVVVLVLLAGWIYELLRRFQIQIDVYLVLAPLALQPAGAMIRVLEDADFFAPFAEGVRAVRPDLPPGSTCVPEVGGGFLNECLGLLMVTPPIYVWMVLLLGAFGRTAHWGQRVARTQGEARGLQFYGLSWAALLALGLAWTFSDPTYVRFTAPIAWLVFSLVAGGGAFWTAYRRTRTYDWRAGLFGYSIAFLVYVFYYVAVWLGGGTGVWIPAVRPLPWVLVVGTVVPVAFALLVALHGRRLSRPGRTTGAGRGWAWMTYVLLVQAFGWFFLSAGILAATGTLPNRAGAATGWWVGGLVAIGAGALLARTYASNRGTHPTLGAFASPLNLLLLGGQFMDALMTSIGLDLFGATEKHVLPRTLIAWVDGLNLPGGLDAFPTLLVLVPYKLILTALLLWFLDVRLKDELASRPNVAPLVKGVAFIVGFSPGLRDMLRTAMGV